MTAYNTLMLLTNHTLTGIALGLATGQPALALPLGIASHLIQDMIPHYGPGRRSKGDYSYRDRFFLILGSLDFTSSSCLLFTALLIWPDATWVVAAGVLGATLPDLTYIPLVIFSRPRVERWLPWYRPMLHFLSGIQRWERPWGLIIELVWASTLVWYLSGWWPAVLK